MQADCSQYNHRYQTGFKK